jgi:hypothetical protein
MSPAYEAGVLTSYTNPHHYFLITLPAFVINMYKLGQPSLLKFLAYGQHTP